LRTQDRIGEKYHSLTIKSISHTKNKRVFVNTICDCGKEKIIALANILGDHPTKSCGHIKDEGLFYYKKEPNYCDEFNRWIAQDVIRRDLECSLTCDDWVNLVTKPCFYCGADPQKVMHNSSLFMIGGIDRMDNDQGYHIENCVPCCGMCNLAKRSMKADDFISWILRAAKHLNK
jgi:hypothetical protein